MEAVKEYLLSVIAAALICAIVSALCGKDGMLPAISKLICGVFLTLVLVSPLIRFQIPSADSFFADVSWRADAITSEAERTTRDEIASVIKSETEAYILDKAKALGADITVSVTLEESEIPIPKSARITGSISPYAKKMLANILQEDLGITTEAQIWN